MVVGRLFCWGNTGRELLPLRGQESAAAAAASGRVPARPLRPLARHLWPRCSSAPGLLQERATGRPMANCPCPPTPPTLLHTLFGPGAGAGQLLTHPHLLCGRSFISPSHSSLPPLFPHLAQPPQSLIPRSFLRCLLLRWGEGAQVTTWSEG